MGPISAMERIADLERRVAELERVLYRPGVPQQHQGPLPYEVTFCPQPCIEPTRAAKQMQELHSMIGDRDGPATR